MDGTTSAIIELLRAGGVAREAGLSEDEPADIEHRYSLRFPDDLRELLLEVLPTGDEWPDWRRGTVTYFNGDRPLVTQMRRVIDGIVFDIESDAFWWAGWGA